MGGEHSSNGGTQPTAISADAFTWALGGGLDVPIVPFFALRFGGDRFSSPTISPGEGSKDRFNAGVVFRF
ncbi:MAG TPA: hypothetical protein VMD29_09365 [Terracidiphilus sp.]|nr:hypothetical protein [Terracidiphilus sp.]